MSDKFPMPEPLRQLNTREEVLAAVQDDSWDEVTGTAEQLLDMFRGLADKQVFGWFAAGYVPFTPELLEQLGEGAKVEPKVESLFTIVVRSADGSKEVEDKPDVYTVKRKGGKLYAMKPRSSTKAMPTNGQPVKVTPAKAKKVKA